MSRVRAWPSGSRQGKHSQTTFQRWPLDDTTNHKGCLTSARRALGKGAGIRRSAPLEFMAHGGPARDPQVAVEYSHCQSASGKMLSVMAEDAVPYAI
eukprot:6471996-Amphidinium_carterae.1